MRGCTVPWGGKTAQFSVYIVMHLLEKSKPFLREGVGRCLPRGAVSGGNVLREIASAVRSERKERPIRADGLPLLYQDDKKTIQGHRFRRGERCAGKPSGLSRTVNPPPQRKFRQRRNSHQTKSSLLCKLLFVYISAIKIRFRSSRQPDRKSREANRGRKRGAIGNQQSVSKTKSISLIFP